MSQLAWCAEQCGTNYPELALLIGATQRQCAALQAVADQQNYYHEKREILRVLPERVLGVIR